jgi:hypothetical protein
MDGIKLKTFNTLLFGTRFFWDVLRYLDWDDALNLYVAFDGVREMVGKDRSALCHSIGAGKESRSRMSLDKLPIDFTEYMLVWHWHKHSAKVPAGSKPDPRFELVVDVYLPVSAQPRMLNFTSSACCFLSEKAPPPFQGAFVSIDQRGRLIVLSPREKKFVVLLRERLTDARIFALVPSAEGSTLLSCSCDGRIGVCKLLPNKIVFCSTSISLWTLDAPYFCFDGEDSFILRTSEKFYDKFSLRACEAGAGPPLKEVFLEVEGPRFVPHLSFIYDPGADNFPPFLLHENYDCGRAPPSRCRCHSFEILVYPSLPKDEQKPFQCVLINSSIIDWVFSRLLGRVYIVALTSNERDTFFDWVPYASRHPRDPTPGEVCGQNIFRECNLVVYAIDLEGFDGYKERRFLRVAPLFYVPNNKKFADYPLALEAIARQNYFRVRSFSSANLTMYKVRICKLFLIVAHKSNLLLFPLRGDSGSRPMGIYLSKPFDVYAFSDDARFAAFLQQDHCNVPASASATRLCSLCPSCSPLFPELAEIEGEGANPPSLEFKPSS